MKRKQPTLAKYFFTKKMKHRNEFFETKIPDYVEADEPIKNIQCNFCDSKLPLLSRGIVSECVLVKEITENPKKHSIMT